MEAIALSLATFFSTFFGGLFVMKNREKLHRIMGFTAGVLLGVVFFDLMPEIIAMLKTGNFNVTHVMIAIIVGFLFFHIIEKSILLHNAHEEEYGAHRHPHVGTASAIVLAGHSFFDGVGIGLAFQVSSTVGVLVAVAVIAHDFTDGMNTVGLVLFHKNTLQKAKWFLLLDALTPVIGAASTLLFSLPERFLVLYLGLFAGFLLYIGASDILPEAHSEHSSWKTIGLTVLGILFIFLVTRFV
ncbi:MAG: ZIP family metal transporter [Patescibacteria group bacterium]|nr:ZIP family metal transporter [Patescibacteria group bacterium]MDE1945894.1 ZIP family metal transporter [Patescibacteria group bacterium]